MTLKTVLSFQSLNLSVPKDVSFTKAAEEAVESGLVSRNMALLALIGENLDFDESRAMFDAGVRESNLTPPNTLQATRCVILYMAEHLADPQYDVCLTIERLTPWFNRYTDGFVGAALPLKSLFYEYHSISANQSPTKPPENLDEWTEFVFRSKKIASECVEALKAEEWFNEK